MTVRRAGAGREEEFAAFVAREGAGLRRYAYLLTGSPADADDLLQASLVRLYLAWDRVLDEDARGAYARRVMARTHASWWRRAARRERPVADLPDGEFSGRDGPGGVEDRDAAWRLLATLPPRTRAVLVLRYYEDLSEAETARALGCSVGSVKSQASRGLARLRADEGATRATILGVTW